LLLLKEGLELLFIELVEEFFTQDWHFYEILGHYCGLSLILSHHLSHWHLLLKLLLLILLHLQELVLFALGCALLWGIALLCLASQFLLAES
jgi:hypothetical protein